MSDEPPGRDRPPFPLWMTAVIQHMTDISTRITTIGDYSPMPALTQLHYALYCDIDPKIAAAILMRDAILMNRWGVI